MATDHDHMPTPEEIEAACLKIQKGWTPAERYSRLVGHACTSKYDAEGVEETARQALNAKLAKMRQGD